MKKSRYGAAFIILAALLFLFLVLFLCNLIVFFPKYMHRKCKYTGFGDTENAVGKWSG